MENNSQSRKWQLTINNPKDSNFGHDVIINLLNGFKSLLYYCLSDEVGDKGTYHTHVFCVFSSAVRFSSMKKKFTTAHFEIARGTSQQNRDYVFKEGKWEKDKKKETNLPETHVEFGDLPVERQGARSDLADLYDMIKSGMDNYTILESNPEYLFNIDKIERARQVLKENKYKSTFRELEVVYLCGATGTGKTRSVMERYGYQNVYRVTDYIHPFDSYKGQDIIIFEEFRSSLKIQDMLNYLDGYPLELPSRYCNRVACFTKVYIITNINLCEQYLSVQKEHLETYRAFLRRINKINIFYKDRVDLFSFDNKEIIPCYFDKKNSTDDVLFSNDSFVAYDFLT